ncbi:type II secretion system protein [Salmonella enterica subsp. enterica]|nr:type II secretion system protein [Salmonella enterica subsp. enterica]
MVNKSVVRRRINESRGFSLLEIIFVLAFLGVILVTAGNYARKLIDEKTRQTAADAVAQDVFGVLQFVNTETFETYRSYDPNDANKRVMKKVTNPLYQLPGMAVYPEAGNGTSEAALKGLTNNPVWLAHPHNASSLDATSSDVSPYIARNYSTSITAPISNDIPVIDGGKTHYSHSLKWSQSQWLTKSVRSYFTDSGCQNGAAGTNVIYFSQQFLSCNENPVLRNSEIIISRIDLVNDRGSFTRISTSADHPAPVNRVDIYVSFWPADRNPARIEQFITPLMTAFRNQKIMPNTDNIFLVMKQSVAGNDNAWTLLNKNNGDPAVKNTPVKDLARYSDLPDLVGKLHEGQTYAIRFSFDGKGDYLRTDGLNSAEKLCWNTGTGAAGPCLTSPAQDALVLKQRQNIDDFANLQVGEVISRGSHLQADGKTIAEYYTSPQIRYAAFNNTGQIPPYFRNPADGATDLCTADTACGFVGPNTDEIADTANGAIAVPLQTCPQSVVDGNGTHHIDMYPRLSAAVSSVVSGIRKNTDGTVISNNTGHYFDRQIGNMVQLNRSDISINRLGGVVLQISQSGATWRIAAMVGSEDNGIKSHPWQYYNPPWLSVMITTWCSSVEQP